MSPRRHFAAAVVVVVVVVVLCCASPAHAARKQPSLATTVAVVTGSTSGFGEAVALRLCARGAAVVVVGRREERGAAVVAACERAGGRALFVRCDQRDDAQVARVFSAARERFGRVTAVFVNAGVFAHGALADDADTASIDSMLDVNVRGTTYVARHAYRTLRDASADASADATTPRPTVVFMSSVGAALVNGADREQPLPTGSLAFSVYPATRAYVDALVRGSAKFDEAHGIRSFVVAPAVYATEMGGEAVTHMVNSFTKGVMGDPDDVARVVEAMIDGTTRWRSGDNVQCEGPYTYSSHERYQQLYAREHFGSVSPPLALDVLRNHRGERLIVTDDDLARIRQRYNDDKQRAAAQAAMKVEM